MKFNNKDYNSIIDAFLIKKYEASLTEREEEIVMSIAKEIGRKSCICKEECPTNKCEDCDFYVDFFISD